MAQNNSSNTTGNFGGNTTGGGTGNGTTTTVGSTGNGSTGNRSGQTPGALGSTDTGSSRSEAGVRPTGEVYSQRVGTETTGYQEARSAYQPTVSEVTVTERRTSRPSSKAVIGSAAAAALVGGAIPFMLSARKSRQSENLSVQRRDANASYGTSYGENESADDRSTPRNRR